MEKPSESSRAVPPLEALRALAAEMRDLGRGRHERRPSRVVLQRWADALEAATAALPKLNVDTMLDVYVPGNWQCPKCRYVLSSQTIFMQSASIGSTLEQVMATSGEVCPNDGEPMHRVTWRDRAYENQKWGESLMEDIIAATGAEHLPGALEAVKQLRAALAAGAPLYDPVPAILDVLDKHTRGWNSKPTTRENLPELIDAICETYTRETALRPRLDARPPVEQEHEEKALARVDGVPEGAHGDLPRQTPDVAPKFVQSPDGDWLCEHGTASDVHCCGCHSGFLFDSRKCICF